MTINDMLEQGIVLQGFIEVKQYNPEMDEYETVFESLEENGLMMHVEAPWAYCQVGYIYSPYGFNGMTIEVDEG